MSNKPKKSFRQYGNYQLPDRVSHLETEVASVKTEVHNVNKNLDIVISTLSDLRHSIGDTTRTNWGVVFAGVMALLGLVVFISNIVMATYEHDLKRIELVQDKLEERFYNNMTKKDEKTK